MLPGGMSFPGTFGRGRGGPNGVRGRFNKGGNKPVWQLCGKQGHIVTKCWYRFDPNFQPQSLSNSSSQSSSIPS